MALSPALTGPDASAGDGGERRPLRSAIQSSPLNSPPTINHMKSCASHPSHRPLLTIAGSITRTAHFDKPSCAAARSLLLSNHLKRGPARLSRARAAYTDSWDPWLQLQVRGLGCGGPKAVFLLLVAARRSVQQVRAALRLPFASPSSHLQTHPTLSTRRDRSRPASPAGCGAAQGRAGGARRQGQGRVGGGLLQVRALPRCLADRRCVLRARRFAPAACISS